MKAPINKIIDFSTVDGPGCRTSIFVQKCNIHCLYCHNPETQNLCISCGDCVKTCPNNALTKIDNKVIWDENKCINCDTCIKTCTHNASPKIINMSALDVFNKIKKNIPFIRGITVSGGECSLYPLFLTELAKLAHENNLTFLMDSNGMVDYKAYKELIDNVDGVMLDIKSWDNEVYNKLTGFSNDVVKSNLIYLNSLNKIEELRIVYVPSLVDAKACLDGIKDILKENINTTRIKLIKFRNNGVKGILSNFENVSDSQINEIYNYALDLGFKNVIVR
ncbi:MAG: YjjW family glycine radical enzyme activase [Acholeplasmatales bacterium]|nr:YjjW family glycine radical enzyme activase [Acholeplasmatales bacterium]